MSLEIDQFWVSRRTVGAAWPLDDEDTTGPREFVHRVAFKTPFESAAPTVSLFFSAIDLGGEEGYRVGLQLKRITKDYFEVEVSTWDTSLVWGCCVGYIAFDYTYNHDKRKRLQTGRTAFYNSDSDFTLNTGSGMRSVRRTIRFPHAFDDKVKLFLGFSSLHLAVEHDARLSVLARDVTKTSFEVRLNTWDNSTLEGATVTWFAYDARWEAPTEDLRLLSGLSKYISHDSGYTLHVGGGARKSDKLIKYKPSKLKSKVDIKPHVVCSLLGAAANSAVADLRLNACTSANDTDSSVVSLATWADSKVDSGMVMYLALFAAPPPAVKASATEEKKKKKKVSKKRKAEDDDDDDDDDSSSDFEAPVKKKAKKTDRDPSSKADDASSSDDRNTCKICFDAAINVVLVPCGHQCCCLACSKLLAGPKTKKECPLCKAKIKSVVRTFSS